MKYIFGTISTALIVGGVILGFAAYSVGGEMVTKDLFVGVASVILGVLVWIGFNVSEICDIKKDEPGRFLKR